VSQEEAYRRIGVAGVGAPLFSDEANLAAVQDLLRQGAFDICVSDHFPHRLEDKYRVADVPGELWPKRGFTSIDFAYPFLLSHAGLAEGARLFAENPARVLGIKKGRIARGYEADLAILEEGDWRVAPDEFESMGKVTPLASQPMRYRVKKTYARGIPAFDRETRTFTKRAVRRLA
jgi:dihydroorotase